MSYAAYTFNAESAKKADSEGSRINSTGKYTGNITKVEFVTSKKGTQGLEFDFVSDLKAETNFTIWTMAADGTPLFGADKINAILACTRTRSLTPTEKQIDKYDFELKQKVKQLCVVAPELENKRIGLLLQAEEYLNSNGQVKLKMNFVAAFEESTELMAKEICEQKTKPEMLIKAFDRLMKNGDKKLQQQSQTQSYGSGYSQSNAPAQDLDDDLPF